MKKIFALFLALGLGLTAFGQTAENTVSAKINGKEWQGKAQRLNLPFTGVKYLAIAGMNVSPDVQTWIRFVYVDQLKPGTYPIIAENDREMERKYKESNGSVIWALVDYTEETKGLGHAFRDGESWKGTVTITSVTDHSIEGTFEATLKEVNYKKRGLATVSGFGLRQNIEDKVVTAAGGGMLTKSGPHDHDNTKRMETDGEITITDGKFKLNWGGNTAQKTK
ncbi:hypothetical protein [Larkinella soli]|uniref:hypothetical protein n=1 Tax=Larkinella soli TaxID=1770527 RepID=UPI000FFC6A85|nr:hypothetical protein [Larkinella soli]